MSPSGAEFCLTSRTGIAKLAPDDGRSQRQSLNASVSKRTRTRKRKDDEGQFPPKNRASVAGRPGRDFNFVRASGRSEAQEGAHAYSHSDADPVAHAGADRQGVELRSGQGARNRFGMDPGRGRLGSTFRSHRAQRTQRLRDGVRPHAEIPDGRTRLFHAGGRDGSDRVFGLHLRSRVQGNQGLLRLFSRPDFPLRRSEKLLPVVSRMSD